MFIDTDKKRINAHRFIEKQNIEQFTMCNITTIYIS
jgi:hypothetical protein